MTRPIRVAHVIDQLALAGAQRVMLRNIASLGPPEFAHTVYTVFRDDSMKPDLSRLGVPCVELGARRALDYPLAIARLWRELRRARPDIVHTEVFPADIVGRVAARLAGTPAILSTFHNPVFESTGRERSARIQNLLQVLTYRMASARAVAVSEAVARSVRASLGETRVAVIRSIVVDVDHWKPITGEERVSARAQLDIRDDDFVIGSVARISVQKGQVYLLRAIARCSRRLTVLLVGDGPLRAEVTRLADKLGIADRVRVTGWQPDPRTSVAACDALVLASLWEGYPLALLEGMSAKMPYIATNVGGVPEIVRDDVEAVIVPPGDVRALALALERLAGDDRLRERIARAGRERALSLASGPAPVEQLGSLYRSLAAREAD